MPTLNLDFPLRDKGVSNSLGTGTLPRHRWGLRKGGILPDIGGAGDESEKVAKRDLLLDPFSGGGTVAVIGAIKGIKTQGFEVPFSAFPFRDQLRHAIPGALLKSSKIVVGGLREGAPSHLEGYSTFSKGNRWNRWLFPSPVLRSFEGGYRALGRAPSGAR